MATISRIRFEWIGTTTVGGGVSTFYSSNSDGSALAGAARSFFVSLVTLLPTGTVIRCPSGGETLDDVTGAVNGVWSMTPGADVIGTQDGKYAAGVGMRVVWNTAGITRRRRVRGSTYLVPLASMLYQADGTIDGPSVAAAQAAATTLAAADGGSMRIWSRPQTATSGDGASHAVLSASAVDKVSWLRTRRT